MVPPRPGSLSGDNEEQRPLLTYDGYAAGAEVGECIIAAYPGLSRLVLTRP